MDPLKTLSSAGQHVTNSYSDKFAIVSDRHGELIAIFCGENAIDMADALVALPGVVTAMADVEEALNRLSETTHAIP